MGDYEAARKSCAVAPDDDLAQVCLAMTYRKLGRNADAEAILQKIKSNLGDDGAYQYAEIYAQWGDLPTAMEWLEMAVRLSSSGLEELKSNPTLTRCAKSRVSRTSPACIEISRVNVR